VVADDVHWLDRSSLDALAFAASRLDAERVVLLVGARGQAPPPGLDRGFPELHLEPLSTDDAGLLLDGQPRPPHGRARAQVLAQAAGNPMALIELTKVIAEDPAASRRWAAEPLPPTDRLTAIIDSRFAVLPEPAQAALLLAAVADGPDLGAAAAAVSGSGAQTLAPAEQLGLIKVDRAGLRLPGLVIHSVYNGYWYWGRPSPEQLRADLRAVTEKVRPDWDITAPGQREAWDRGDKSAFWPYGVSLREVFAADPSEG
jgi:predicted ATPase